MISFRRGFSRDDSREALSCALEILCSEPLAEITNEEGRRVWTFPPLARRAETDPSWAATLDTLRSRRKPMLGRSGCATSPRRETC